MHATILHALLLVTIAMAVVLLARRPMRHGFGAGPAFTLWALPLLAVALPWLPALPAHWAMLPTLNVLPDHAPATASPVDAASAASWLWPAWLVGVSLGLLRLVLHYLRLRRQSRRWPEPLMTALLREMDALDPRRLRIHPDGPAVLWAPRSLLLLPADFMQRFNADERRLVLRHELAHLHRGDMLWSLLAELACALLWFHPLMWLALPRFRLDQELACDERVLRNSPQDEASYARILMQSVGTAAVPTLIPWLAEPQLKERLTMIERYHPGALRRRIGYLGLAALMAGSAMMAQAGTGPLPDQQASADLAGNAKMQPRYPASAIKNGEEGTVVLIVQVHADNTVGSIAYDPQQSTTTSADLIAAASNAAREWHFNPPIKGGIRVDGYARVPVKFSLTPLLGETDSNKAEKASSKHQ